MRIFKREKKNPDVEYRAGFTDGVISQILGSVSGGRVAVSEIFEIAAAEYGIGLLSRCFASATRDPVIPGMNTSELARVCRSMLTEGNFLASLDVVGGEFGLDRAQSWHMTGRLPTNVLDDTLLTFPDRRE